LSVRDVQREHEWDNFFDMRWKWKLRTMSKAMCVVSWQLILRPQAKSNRFSQLHLSCMHSSLTLTIVEWCASVEFDKCILWVSTITLLCTYVFSCKKFNISETCTY
jgi:hypothetical protein